LQYREFKLRPPLDRWVECIWYLEVESSSDTSVQRVLPDGRMELVIHVGEPFSYHKSGSLERQGRVMLSGQLSRPLLLMPRAGGRVLGIRFKPAGASALFRFSLADLTDQLCALDQVSQGLQHALLNAVEQSVASGSISPHTIDKVAEVLLSHSRNSPPPIVNAAVSELENSDGTASVSRVAESCGVSERQLERLFRQHVGLTPKTLSRLLRFQRALVVGDERTNWAEVAMHAGYYDQSHLLRDFRQFAGETPAYLLSSTSDLAEHFTARNRCDSAEASED
jgi:AraC-like DNA-binding protein